MPIVFERSFESLQGSSLNELISNTNISRTTPGAKAKSLLEAVNRKLNRAYQEVDINMLRSFLPYAEGRFLDYLGDMLGVTRLGATRASASAEAQLVKFYVDTGTFGDINSGSDITIPAGTLITSEPNNEGIRFRVVNGIVLSAALSEQYISVEAVRDGEFSNVGKNTLIYHNFTNYADATGLKVNNVNQLTSGRDPESDTNYKFRIANQTLAAEMANETAIRLAILSVPGVSNIVVREYARGIGSSEILIQATIPNTPDSVIEAAQVAIARVKAHGIQATALRPRLTGMSFQFSITWRADTADSEKESIRRSVQVAISNYINNLDIGESFIYNEAIERAMSVSNQILNIGTAEQAIDLVNIYRENDLQDNKIKEELIADYNTMADERLIIEPTVSAPIVVIDA